MIERMIVRKHAVVAWLKGWRSNLEILIFRRDQLRKLTRPIDPAETIPLPRPEVGEPNDHDDLLGLAGSMRPRDAERRERQLRRYGMEWPSSLNEEFAFRDAERDELEKILRRLARSLHILLTLEQEHELATHWRDELEERTYGDKTCHVCADIDEIWFALKDVPEGLSR